LTQRLVCLAGRVAGLTLNTLIFSDKKAHADMGIWGGSARFSFSLVTHLEAGHDWQTATSVLEIVSPGLIERTTEPS